MDAVRNTSLVTDMQVDPDYLLASRELCVAQIKSGTDDPKQPHELERCAWLPFDEVWRWHRVGFRKIRYKGDPAHLRNASWDTVVCQKRFIRPPKFSERLEAMVEAIKDVPSVAQDVTRGANLVDLASSPHLLVLEKRTELRRRWRKARASPDAKDKPGFDRN
ncbi:hypothetical protein AC579_71 [Pseudocercospora musae]|uniref:Uncharacterized protein n=1 Tax=Pseudocercospora musae TaxID=113226 RepID=A0A139I2T0_9PEZI|nr:hypothetical protein AC579_71 [Pseudocercospora musae]KXT08989.1 hypothetical protein AC579_71 [Pseudocercospora musae]